MDFQKIEEIREPDFYLEVAFRRARTKRDADKVALVKDYLTNALTRAIRSYPSLDDLEELHKELIHLLLDFDQIKKSLGALNWASDKIRRLARVYKDDYKGYYGRVSSLLKKVSDDMIYLEKARRVLREFPAIKKNTVCIVGFPNVGKTTLLSKITTSKPEINEYAFTTKRLNLGYMDGLQVVDTPGTLARPDKMNDIEKQAYLALKYLAKVVVYVFDLTEPYPLEDQIRLYEEIKSLEKPTLVFLSKEDLVNPEQFEEFLSQNNLEGIVELDKLKEEIHNLISST